MSDLSDDGDARSSGEEQQLEQPENTETTMSESQSNTDNNELPPEEDAPSVCTEFQTEHPLENDDDADFAFICPRCKKPNALVGQPTEFANKPFRCLNCNYVPLLDAETLEKFAKESDL